MLFAVRWVILEPMWQRWILFLVTVSLLLGCNRSPSAVPLIVPEWTPTVTPASVPVSVPASTRDADLCPARRGVAFPARPAAFDEYVETLRVYLADGGDPKRLPALLGGWQAKAATGETLARADLNGDGSIDNVVAFINPASTTYPPESTLAIYTCREGTVRALYTYAPGVWFGLNLVGAADVTQDGLADLIFTEIACGAQACWHTLRVWSWAGRDFEERVGQTFTFVDAVFALQDGQIAVGRTGSGTVDAGPQRPVTTTLAWAGDGLTVTATLVGPAVYRYHAFRDGDEALFAGRYAHALDAYLRVRNSETLKAWAVHLSRDEEEHWFAALVDWRLLLLELRVQNVPNAQTYYDHLLDTFLPGTAGYAVAALARRFVDSYNAHGDMALACAETIRVPEAQEVLDFLNSFGYDNPTYTWSDLCPFLSTD